jgi:hypothetical protein
MSDDKLLQCLSVLLNPYALAPQLYVLVHIGRHEILNLFRTEAAFQSEKHGTSSTSDQSVENNDGPGYLRKEGNLFMKASKAGAVGQSALDRDEMTVQE